MTLGEQNHEVQAVSPDCSHEPLAISVRITTVRKLAVEAADNGLLSPDLAAGSARVKGVKSKGVRVGKRLSIRQAQMVLNTPDLSTKKGLRDRAMLAVLLGCGCVGLRWRELSVSLCKESSCGWNRRHCST